MLNKTQLDKLETVGNQSHADAGKLMINFEPSEDFNDFFLNQSLSEGYFSIDLNRKRQNSSPQGSQDSHSNEDDQEKIEIDQFSKTIKSPLESSKQQLVWASHQNQITDHSEKPHAGKDMTFNQSDESQHAITPPKPRNIYSRLISYFLTKKFAQKLAKKYNKNTYFKEYHYKILNDKGSSLNLKLFSDNALRFKPVQTPSAVKKVKPLSMTRNILNRVFASLKTVRIRTLIFIDQIPLFYPESTKKLIWDGVVVIARVYFMLAIPLDLGFDKYQFLFGSLLTSSVLMITLLLIDLVISFNSAYYQYGQIVTQRTQIILHVLGKYGGVEIVGIVLLVVFLILNMQNSNFEVNVSSNWYQLFLILFSVQYKNIVNFIRQTEETYNLSKPASSMLELIKLIAAVMYVLHVFSCLWFWVGNYSIETSGQSWLEMKPIERTFQIEYLYSFYYSTVTMFTIGYGDLSPQSDLEHLVCIFFMMISSIQLSYSVSTVGAIIDKISVYEAEKMKKVQVINAFMQNKKITFELQYQIREYLNYFWKAENEVDHQNETAIIEQLSENLREKLMVEANSLILNSIPFFKDHLSQPLKRKLVKCIRQIVIQPENIINFDTIFNESKKNQIFMCFIEKGGIEIFLENDTAGLLNNNNNNEVSIVSTVGAGMSLGVTSFITGKKAPEHFKSIGFTKLLLLSRDDFLKIIPDFPEDYEQYMYFHDQLRLYQTSDFIKMKCFSCNSIYHRALDCPLLHFVPDREFILKKNQFSRNQERNEFQANNLQQDHIQLDQDKSVRQNPVFQRKNEKKKLDFHAMLDQEFIEEAAICIQNDNYQETMFYDCEEEDQVALISSQRDISLKVSDNLESYGVIIEDTDKLKIPGLLQKSRTKFIPDENQSDSSENLQSLQESPNQYQSMTRSSIRKVKKSVQFQNERQDLRSSNVLSLQPIMEEERQFEEPKLKARRSQTIDINQPGAKQFQSTLQKQNSQATLKSKFKKAVHIVAQMNDMRRNQRIMRSSNRAFLESSLIEQERQGRLTFERGQLSSLLLRSKRLSKSQKSSFPTNKDMELAEFTLLRLQMITNLKSPLDHFESLKTFKYYFPHNNLDNVLEKEVSYFKPNRYLTPTLPTIFSSFVRYLLYPFEYIERYKFQVSALKEFQLLHTTKKIEIERQRKKNNKKKSFSSRKSQVRPLSDGAILTKLRKKH